MSRVVIVAEVVDAQFLVLRDLHPAIIRLVDGLPVTRRALGQSDESKRGNRMAAPALPLSVAPERSS